MAIVLFLPAGKMDWIWAWVYPGISLVCLAVNGTILLRTNPETIAERSRSRETKNRDKVVGGLWGAAVYVALPPVAGPDMHFGWNRDLIIAWPLAGAFLPGTAGMLSTYLVPESEAVIRRGGAAFRPGGRRFFRGGGSSRSGSIRNS
jgi:hypothetical protein